MIVILHNIRSIFNVGSIFRTADAAGIEKIYLCGITPSPLDKFDRPCQALIKVSLGAEKYIEWERRKSASHLIDELKKQGYKIFCVEQNKKSIPYYKANLWPSDNLKKSDVHKLVLIFGNEVKGLPPSILNRAERILEIPMKGKKESLNVAVAFGIVVFSLIN